MASGPSTCARCRCSSGRWRTRPTPWRWRTLPRRWGARTGSPSALAFDLEWYATEQPAAIDDGFTQLGVVHGVVELPGAPLRLEEIPAQRWRRWGDRLGPLGLPSAYAHTGVRAPFAFPDGSVADWVLTPDGWRALGA